MCYATKLLVSSKRRLESLGHKISSLADIGRASFGTFGYLAVLVLTFICQLGVCIVYCIFIGRSITGIFVSELPDNPDETSITPAAYYVILAAGVTPVLLLLSWIRSMKYLAKALIVATTLMTAGVVIIIAYGATNAIQCDPPASPATAQQCTLHIFRWETYPIFLGVVVFALEGMTTVLPIESAMAEPERFDALLHGTFATLAVVYMAFGSVAYVMFRRLTLAVIAINVQGVFGVIVKLLLCAVRVAGVPL